MNEPLIVRSRHTDGVVRRFHEPRARRPVPERSRSAAPRRPLSALLVAASWLAAFAGAGHWLASLGTR
jgi:hypothetical protein